jgi:hypothetical protein
MEWENIRDFFGLRRSSESRVSEITPRPLNECEMNWIQDILHASEGWSDADLSRTLVTAEGPCDEGRSLILKADQPHNPDRSARSSSIGELWIQTSDGSVINIQLSQSDGYLRELYVLFVGPKRFMRRRADTLPDTWKETSRQSVGFR